MATVTHLPSDVMDGHTFTCTDREAAAAVAQFIGTAFAVEARTVETRNGESEFVNIVRTPSGAARILVVTGQ